MSLEEAPRCTERPQEDPAVAGKCEKWSRYGSEMVPQIFPNGPEMVSKWSEEELKSLFERKGRKTLKMTTLSIKMLDFEGSK